MSDPVTALALERVTVELGGRNVVDGVSFVVEQGDWVTLIGPNGAGKTSLLRAVAGLVGHRGRDPSRRRGGAGARAARTSRGVSRSSRSRR